MGLKNIVARLAGKIIARKLDLQEGAVDETKKWWKSKTVLTGLVTALIGIWEIVDLNVAPSFGFDLPAIPEWFFIILGALGIYGRVSADKKIG